jgi:hypothetical protein
MRFSDGHAGVRACRLDLLVFRSAERDTSDGMDPDGTPDMTFNHGIGSIHIDLSSGSHEKAYGVGIDGSGRTVVGGDWQRPAVDQSIAFGAAVARLNPDGTLDTSVGTNGVKTGAVLSTLGHSTKNGYAVNGLAIGKDGSYDLAGSLNDPTNDVSSTLLVHKTAARGPSPSGERGIVALE